MAIKKTKIDYSIKRKEISIINSARIWHQKDEQISSQVYCQKFKEWKLNNIRNLNLTGL